MDVRGTVLRLHRWLSVFVAAVWLLQALTGLFAVFHWEIDDAGVRGPRRPTDFGALERAVGRLAPAGSGLTPSSLWTTAGAPDRWDLSLDAASPARGATLRLDGGGAVLRRRTDGERFSDGGWVDTLVTLHHNLLAGDRGRALLGLSGALLLTNIGFGLFVAWPPGGTGRRGWRRALTPPPRRGPPPARLYGWHRAVGLWAAAPAALTVSAGVLLAFDDSFERWVAPMPQALSPAPAPGRAPVGLSQAVAIARARHPEARISGIDFPSAAEPAWTVRLNLPGEGIRAYGKSRVEIGAADGQVRLDFDERRAPVSRWVFDHLFAFHTGEMAGPVGRAAVFAVGLWLASMTILGVLLWQTRRRRSKEGRA